MIRVSNKIIVTALNRLRRGEKGDVIKIERKDDKTEYEVLHTDGERERYGRSEIELNED